MFFFRKIHGKGKRPHCTLEKDEQTPMLEQDDEQTPKLEQDDDEEDTPVLNQGDEEEEEEDTPVLNEIVDPNSFIQQNVRGISSL